MVIIFALYKNVTFLLKCCHFQSVCVEMILWEKSPVRFHDDLCLQQDRIIVDFAAHFSLDIILN
jgi:hypothetical protein